MTVFARGASTRRRIAAAALMLGGLVAVVAVALVFASLRTPDGTVHLPAFVERAIPRLTAQSPAPTTTSTSPSEQPGASPPPLATSGTLPVLSLPSAFAVHTPTPSPRATTTPTVTSTPTASPVPMAAPTAAPVTPQPTPPPTPSQVPLTTFPGRTAPPRSIPTPR